jgi:hypothetical protein
MSTIADVQELYNSLQGSWQKTREHIFAHIIFAFIVFILFGAELPPVKLLLPNPANLAENEWFRIAKDTGLLFLLLIIPIALLAIYASLFSFAARLMVGIVMAVAPPMASNVNIDMNNITLVEPLAILTKKNDFTLADIQSKATDLIIRYQARNGHAWQNYEKSISRLNKGSLVFPGDFPLFFLFWNFAFAFAEQNSWIDNMQPLRLKVSVVLFLLILASWFRVSRSLSIMPRLLITNIAIMVRADEDLLPFLEVSAEEREKTRARLFNLLADSQERNGSSLLGMLIGEPIAFLREQVLSLQMAKHLRRAYLRGEKLRYSRCSKSRSLHTWTNDLLALLLYNIVKRLELTRKSVCAYLKVLLSGSA